jgi:RNA polymerase sigma-70 factor (ECF subfamily)
MQATVERNIILEPRYKAISVELSDTATIQLLTAGNEAEFEQVFKTHYKALHSYACTILKDEMAAEEIVQQIFLKIWERKQQLSIQSSIRAYLYRAVYNDCLNVLKHEKVKKAYQTYTTHFMKNETDHASTKILLGDLEDKFRKAMNELPEQCRTIFQMSRFEELNYQQIADKLGLSIKTIENQMGKALKLMRLKLVDFLPLLLLSLLHL